MWTTVTAWKTVIPIADKPGNGWKTVFSSPRPFQIVSLSPLLVPPNYPIGISHLPWSGTQQKSVEGCLDLKPPHREERLLLPAKWTGWKYRTVNTGQEKGNKRSVSCPTQKKETRTKFKWLKCNMRLCADPCFTVCQTKLHTRMTNTTLGKGDHTIINDKVPFFIIDWYFLNSNILIKYPG
jgi:hypothetical protein